MAINLDKKSAEEIIDAAQELVAGGSSSNRQTNKYRIRAILNGGADGIKALLGNQMDTADSDLLPAPNLLQSGIDRLAQKISGVPNIRVDLMNNNDSDRARKRADKLERIVASYDEKQRLNLQLAQAARWLPGYGYCAWIITHKQDKNGFLYPTAELRDPYDTYPGNFGPDQKPQELAVLRSVPRWKLAQIYPEYKNVILKPNKEKGTPNTSSIGAIGAYADCGTSKERNLGIDAIDFGTGLFVYGGGGVDPDCTFDDFLELDEGNVENRFGSIFSREGILYNQTKLILGASSSLDSKTTQATTFEDSNVVIVFPSYPINASDIGIDVDLNTASTTVTFSSCTFNGRGNQASGSRPDNRPCLVIFGNAGTLTSTSDVFTGFCKLDLSSSCTFTNTTVTNTAYISQSGATFSDCVFSNHTTEYSQSFICSDNPSLISNCSFDNLGGSGSALEVKTAGTYTFTGNTFVGYSGLNQNGS